eukprot:14768311-Heterocapsa_arctica.AAC.1
MENKAEEKLDDSGHEHKKKRMTRMTRTQRRSMMKTTMNQMTLLRSINRLGKERKIDKWTSTRPRG